MRIDDVLVAWIPPGSGYPNGLIEVRSKQSTDPIPAGANVLPADDCFEVTRTGGHPAQMYLSCLTLFNVVVRAGISPAAAHEEFCKIDEYKGSLEPDCHGPTGFTPRRPQR